MNLIPTSTLVGHNMVNYKIRRYIENIVNGIGTSGNALTFQPASGIQVHITHVNDFTNGTSLDNGTTTTTAFSYLTSKNEPSIFINNTIYLTLLAGASLVRGYSGYEIP